MTAPRETPNIYSLKGETATDIRATKINSSHVIHAGMTSPLPQRVFGLPRLDGSPQWIQKVISKVLTKEEAVRAQAEGKRARVLTFVTLYIRASSELTSNSVWRPLVDVVETDPLVCCDVQTVKDTDLDIVQKVMDDTVEESMYLKWRKEHQWYWMSNQTREDVIVMTVWDSNKALSKSGKQRIFLIQEI